MSAALTLEVKSWKASITNAIATAKYLKEFLFIITQIL
jgi:hypothetical protein